MFPVSRISYANLVCLYKQSKLAMDARNFFFFFLLIQVSSDPCMKNTAYIKLVIKLLMNCFEHLLSLSVITAMLMYTCLSCWVIAQEVVGEGIQFL